MLAVGDEVAGYRVDGVLGHGGMGVVYEATEVSLDRKVALKILAAHLTDDPTFRRRFQREGQIQAGIDHPHIITVYAAGQMDEGLFIAMRMVRGPTLKTLIQSGDLDPARSLAILRQVADALDAAHEAGLIHRDVKPQNVLVAARDHTYLADFGLTKAPDHTGLTKTDQFLGTIDYVSPEQIRGEDAVQASDVYALGGVLYECMTGTVPFPKPSDTAVLFAHVSEPPPRITALRPGFPEALDQVIARAMAKAPADRYPTASDLVSAAEAACASAPVAVPSGAVSVTLADVSGTVADVPATVADVPATVADRPATVADVPATVVDATSPTLADTAPMPAGPDDGSGTGQRTRRWVLALIGGAAIVAVALGLLLSGGKSSEKAPIRPRTIANADLIVRHPATWKPSSRRPPTLALPAAGAIHLKPASRTDSGLTAGQTKAVGVDLVPTRLSRRLAETPPSREPVRVGRYEGYRFPDLKIRGLPGSLTLYAIPTTTGVTALACYGPQSAISIKAACEQIVSTVSLRTGKTGPLGPDRGFAAALADAMGDLNAARISDRRAIKNAATTATVARKASAIVTAYGKALAKVRAVDVTPEALPAQRSIERALDAARDAYKELAAAAEKESATSFSAKSRTVRIAEQQLRQALDDLRKAGYRVSG